MTQQLEDLEIIGVPDRQDIVRIERSERWVRAYLDGRVIADSKRVLLVFEPRRLPVSTSRKWMCGSSCSNTATQQRSARTKDGHSTGLSAQATRCTKIWSG